MAKRTVLWVCQAGLTWKTVLISLTDLSGLTLLSAMPGCGCKHR